MSDLYKKSDVTDRPVMTDEYHHGAVRRPSVSDYLKQQRDQRVIQRMPEFERDMYDAINELQEAVRQQGFALFVMGWMLAGGGAVAIIVLLALFGGAL